jgi:hypothetical protein
MNRDALTQYEPANGHHNAMLVGWWLGLLQRGELGEIAVPRDWPIAAFTASFDVPARMWFKADDGVVWFHASVRPFLSGGLFGFWCDAERARTPSFAFALEQGLAAALEQYEVVVGTSRLKQSMAWAGKLGYNVVGVVPKLWDGSDVHFVYMTRETFAARELRLEV